MAKLRRNHARRGGAASGTTIVKIALFAAIIFALLWGFRHFVAGTQVQGEVDYRGEAWLHPAGSSGQIIDRDGFVFSYNEEWEQAEWVAYVLSREELDRKWTEREDNFREDPLVSTGTANAFDYRGSGYDRGHLAPFADFAWNADLADRTFFMSNVSPQAPAFNQGIWRELEELTRDWARDNGQLYVVTGPVTRGEPLAYIGRDNRIAIPRAYFKVLLDLQRPQRKGIGFLLPNEESTRPVTDYAMSIDAVEEATGLDFFPELMPEKLERSVEAAFNTDLWPQSENKYDRRLQLWNKVK